MTKREITLLAVACTFIGIVLGFLLAPIKARLSIGNNNTIKEMEESDSHQ